MTHCCSWRACSPRAPPRGGQADANFQLWQLLVFIPIAAILGGQVGYLIGRNVGTAMFKPNARFLKQQYLDEAHAFFEQRGPFAIVIARFVPIVRTLAPITAGAARMSYGVFALFNIIGAVVWGVGLTLLGYGLGQFEIIQKLLEPIFILDRAGVRHPDVHRVVQAAPGGQEGRRRTARPASVPAVQPGQRGEQRRADPSANARAGTDRSTAARPPSNRPAAGSRDARRAG